MFFIALAAAALLLTMLWLWQSLRLAFVHVMTDEPPTAAVSVERSALLAEKKALLLALKDLEAERDSGKLSQEDFVELNDQYRTRARTALRSLDAMLAPYRGDAKALLARAAEDGVKASASEPAQPAAGTCTACATANDPDAVFCKKCGTRLSSGTNA
jgi:hypothetical protein